MKKQLVIFLISLLTGLAHAQVQEITIDTDGSRKNTDENIIVSHMRGGGFAGKMIHELGVFSLMKDSVGEEKALTIHQFGSSLWNVFSTKGLVTLLGASSGVSVAVGIIGGVLVYNSMEEPKQTQLAKLKNSAPTQMAMAQGREYPDASYMNTSLSASEKTFEIVAEVADPIEAMRSASLPELVLTSSEKKLLLEKYK